MSPKRHLYCVLSASLGWVLAAFAAPASAEVKSASAGGFEIVRTATVTATPEQAFAQLIRVGEWWSGAHSYSGDAKNMTIDPRPGGCFCEVVEGGVAVEHMRVVFVQPGKTLRLSGGLGPLQAEGVAGALTWTFKPVEGGTQISATYVVGGFIRGGAEAIAPPVDFVLGEQVSRLAALLNPARK